MKVICTLPNASELISGVVFAAHALGMISEEISAEQAADFLSIPGYVDAEAPADAPATPATEPAVVAPETVPAAVHDEPAAPAVEAPAAPVKAAAKKK